MKRVIRCSRDTSDYIDYLQTKIRILENDLERDEYRDDQERLDDYEALEELRQELNFAWQDDEAEYNYAVQQQEFNPDGSLKLYGSTRTESDPINSPYQVVLRDGELYKDPDTDDIIEINSKPIIKEVSSLEEAMRVYQQYLHSNNITGSQNTGGLVLKNDKPVAVLSYNGRHIDDFNDYINKWGKGILYNSNVLKSLGCGIEASTNDVLTDEEKETLHNADTSEWSKMMSERLEDDINRAGGYDKYIKRERVYSSLASSSDHQMSSGQPTRLSIYKRQLKEVREDIEQFENTPKRLRHPEYNKRLAELKRKEASLIKWISEDEAVNTKSSIKASTLWDQGWSKRLNKDSGETYFVFTCPKATGYVSKGLDADSEGKYNSQAEVHFLRDDIYLKKTFFGKDSEFDAMAWAEDVIFE